MDRNIVYYLRKQFRKLSLSARRAWIEIQNLHLNTVCGDVALRKESVDRNTGHMLPSFQNLTVALRKESVDRNALGGLGGAAPQVALRKESVDRNGKKTTLMCLKNVSLSARRAWIEICNWC